MVGIFRDNYEIIVVGLNSRGDPIDPNGKLFGINSGRDINEFERYDVDTDKGQTAHLTLGVTLHPK